MSDHHGHDHDDDHPVVLAGARFLIFSVVEMLAGIITANTALVTSAIHDFLDGIGMRQTGKFDEKWESSTDHSLYCTSRGLLGIGMALFIPAVSSLGLLVEPRDTISTGALVTALAIGGCSLTLNLVGLFQTWRRHDALHLGYLIHFVEDAIGSMVVIAVSCWAYATGTTRMLWYGSLAIIIATFLLGVGSSIHTLWLIGHRAENHDHRRETPEQHQRHATEAAS